MKAAIAVFAILAASGAQAGDLRRIERVFIKDSDVYAVYADANESRRLTTDGRSKHFLAVSRDGTRVAFVVDIRKQALGTILILAADGSKLQEIVFRPEQTSAGAMTFIEQLEWLTRNRLVVAGSFNPLAAEYVTIDVNSGKELRSYFVRGSAWKPSPDGAHFVYEYYEPFLPRFCLDDECRFDGTGGYPPKNRHLEFDWEPAWSRDGAQVAIVAKDAKEKDKRMIVVRRVGAGVDELPAPEEAEGAIGVSWDGPDLIVVSAKRRWRMNVARTGFDPLAR